MLGVNTASWTSDIADFFGIFDFLGVVLPITFPNFEA
jgi:hypothetical protein